MAISSLLNKVKRLERSVRPGVAAANDPWPVATLLPLLVADDATWRDWLALCAAPCLDAAGRLAARVNAAITAEPAAEGEHS
jgi:hypothetical protein